MYKKQMIVVENLDISIKGRRILSDINFTAYAEELTVLLGLNGAGKTTLFRSIIGVLKPESGQIILDDVPLEQLPYRQRALKVSYLVQNTSLPMDIKVFDFVLLGATPHLGAFALPKKSHYIMVEEALSQLGITHLAGKSMLNISGGERQMTFLARALVQRSDIMLLDEPTAYLDFRAGHTFMDKLKSLIRQQKKTAMAILHDPNLAIKYADRIIMIHDGTVLAQIDRQEDDFMSKANKCIRLIYGEKADCFACDDKMFIDWKTD